MERKFKHKLTNKVIKIGGKTGLSCQTLIGNSNLILGDIIKGEDWQEVVEKDYEILSFITIESELIKYKDLDIDDDLNCDKYLKIYSVKRKDGEIFTIGDKTNFGLISKIVINNNSLSFYFEQKSCGYNLQTLIKWKPLFTTEDGVDIFKNINKYYTPIYIVDKALNIRHCEKDFSVKPSENVKYFFNKEKAEEYILMNKPVLSLKEIYDLFPGYLHSSSTLIPKLKELVQQKLNK